jgi:hypothetical protein
VWNIYAKKLKGLGVTIQDKESCLMGGGYNDGHVNMIRG